MLNKVTESIVFKRLIARSPWSKKRERCTVEMAQGGGDDAQAVGKRGDGLCTGEI